MFMMCDKRVKMKGSYCTCNRSVRLYKDMLANELLAADARVHLNSPLSYR